MGDGKKTFWLRYVGARFEGTRLPLDVLSDLPAFRDLLVSYAKDEWRRLNPDKKRLPKGFDKSISFDLVGIEEGSTKSKLEWNREVAQVNFPGFTDELEELVDHSNQKLVELIDNAGNDRFPQALSSAHILALNKFGSGLLEKERIEFSGTKGADGNVVYLDTHRRKKLITRVSETYEARFEGVGRLLSPHICGHIDIDTTEHGEIRIPVDADRIKSEFDGNINEAVQFALQIKLDNTDTYRGLIEVFDVELIDAQIGADLARCRNRLAELQLLGAGWHDGSGASIDAKAVETAEGFLSKRPFLASKYRIYPTLEGGVQFEFDANGWDYSVEFLSGGAVEMYGVQTDGPDEIPPASFEGLNDTFLRVFDERTGS